MRSPGMLYRGEPEKYICMILSRVISSAIEQGKQFVKILGWGKDDVKTVQSVFPFGIEGNPLPGYRAIYASTAAKDKKILIGVLFENSVADVGELRLHSEDSDGNEIASIHLKNNGDIEIVGNGSSTINLREDGIIEINGDSDYMVRFSELESAFNTLKSDLNSFILTYNSHIHITTATIGASATPGVIAPTTSAGTSSSADVSGAKIDNVKSN